MKSDHLSKYFQPDVETVEEFVERFKKRNFEALSTTKETEKLKKAMLLANALPVNVLTDIQRRLKPTLLSGATYEDIEKQLISLYSTKKSHIGASVSFLSRKQSAGESIVNYGGALNQLASQCNYEQCCRDRMVRDVFISGLRSPKIITALISECENKTFNEVLEKAKIVEQIHQDVVEINPSAKTFNQNVVQKYNNKSKFSPNSNEKNSKNVSSNYMCSRCGTKGGHLSNTCWARTVDCRSCGKTGYISKQCRTKKSENNGSSNENWRNKNNKTNYMLKYNEEIPEEIDPARYFKMNYIKKNYCASSTGNSTNEREAGGATSNESSARDNRSQPVYESTNERRAFSSSANGRSWTADISGSNRFLPLSTDKDTDISGDMDICAVSKYDDAYDTNMVKSKLSNAKKQKNSSFLDRRTKSMSILNQ